VASEALCGEMAIRREEVAKKGYIYVTYFDMLENTLQWVEY